MENLTYLVYLFSFQLSTGLFFYLVFGSMSLIPSVLFLFAFLCCRWFHAVSIPLLSCDTDSLPEPHPRCWTPCSYSTVSTPGTWLPASLTASALSKWICVLSVHRKEVSGYYLMDSPFSTFSGHWQLFHLFFIVAGLLVSAGDCSRWSTRARELCLIWRPYSQQRKQIKVWESCYEYNNFPMQREVEAQKNPWISLLEEWDTCSDLDISHPVQGFHHKIVLLFTKTRVTQGWIFTFSTLSNALRMVGPVPDNCTAVLGQSISPLTPSYGKV